MQSARFYWLSNNDDHTPPLIGSMDVISPIDFSGVGISLKKISNIAVCKKKNSHFTSAYDKLCAQNINKENCTVQQTAFWRKKKVKILLPWQLAQSLVRQTLPVLPPLHSWPGALAAAACLAGAF